MNFIYKLGILLAMLLASVTGKAQSQSDKIYEMFSGKDGVSSISFSKSAIKPFEMYIDEKTKKVLYNMEKIRFLHYNGKKGKLSALNVFSRMKSELNGVDYFEIDQHEISTKHDDFSDFDQIGFFGRGNRYEMDEFHVVIFDDETSILLSFYGPITVEDLKELGNFTQSTHNIIIQ
jgi:hypothetical protein